MKKSAFNSFCQSPLTMQEKIKAAKATSSTENVMGQLAEYTRRLSTKTPKIEKEGKKNGI